MSEFKGGCRCTAAQYALKSKPRLSLLLPMFIPGKRNWAILTPILISGTVRKTIGGYDGGLFGIGAAWLFENQGTGLTFPLFLPVSSRADDMYVDQHLKLADEFTRP